MSRYCVRSMGHRVVQVVLIVLLGAAPLLLLEGGLRLAGWPTDRVRTFGKLVNRDAQSWNAIVGMFRPDARATVMWPVALEYTVHINSLGLRGAEVERTPPAGRTRVLALGDSMTFGYYLEEDETWPARLQARLRRSGADVDVVNAGVGGWTVDSTAQFLLERGLALEPDHVVLGFFNNDPRELLENADLYGRVKGSIGTPRERFSAAVHATALYELYLRFQVRLKHWRKRSNPRPIRDIFPLPPDQAEEAWKIYADWVDRMQGALEERGAELTLLYLPSLEDLETDPTAPNEARLRALAAERGLPFVSLLADFQADPVPGLYHVPIDGHLAAEGAERVARELGDSLALRLTR